MNLCMLILALLFIFLTFREGDKNWLHPLMSGTLKWNDLGAYLNLNLFFRPPFLAVWIGAYAAVYYAFARTGREALVLQVTAIFATAYIALCLRDLVAYRTALIIVDCIGIASVFASFTSQKPLGLRWICLPLACGGIGFLLFHDFAPQLTVAGLNPEFAVLAAGALVLFAGLTMIAWKRGFLKDWSSVLPFAFSAFLLFSNNNFPSAPNYNKLLSLGFSLPHYFLGELLICAILLLLGLCYKRWRPNGSIRWLDVVGLIVIAWTLLDLRFSQITGARLDWQVISLGLGETPKMMWRMARPYLPRAAIFLFATAGIYFLLVKAAQTWIQRREISRGPTLAPGISYVLLSFLLLGFAGKYLMTIDKIEPQAALLLAETSPLLRRTASRLMDQGKFTETARQLGMTQLLQKPASAVAAGAPRDLNVVLIFQESTYNKHLSLFSGKEPTQPLLSKYKDRMELFPNFFSSFAGSINARFATFTGLYPVPDYHAFTLQHVGVKSIFEILHEHGYQSSLFYSSSFDYTGFRDFLRGREIDRMYDTDNMPGAGKERRVSWGVREDVTLGAMQEQIKQYAKEKEKFFLTYIPAAPHYPYDGVPTQFSKYRLTTMGDYTPLYHNEMRYMDWIISSLVDQLKSSGLLDKTLIVITSDHGEMLGEDGGSIGHGWAITPELANIPLILMDPSRESHRVNPTIGSQVDLLPTLLDVLNIPVPEKQLYQGTSLYRVEPDSTRTIYLNSFQQFGIIKGSTLVSGDRQRDNLKSFAIRNDGSRTIFDEAGETGLDAGVISIFDAFQASFLANYSRYCESTAAGEKK
ncbi:MAG: LTA synthase family protein [Verrucomicrobiota bacterium]